MKKALLIVLLLAAAANGKPIRCTQNGSVETVAFSPDGKNIAAGGADRFVRIWDAIDGKQLRELPIYDATEKNPGVTCVAFSPDGKKLAVAASLLKPVSFWDLASGAKVDQKFEVNSSKQFAWGVAFSPDGASLAMASPSGLELWDLKTKKRRFVEPMGEWFQPRKVAFSPDGSLLATEAGRIFKTESGERFWEDKDLVAKAIAFSPNGKLFVTGRNRYYDLDIWDLLTKKRILAHADKQPGVVFCVSVSPDGKTIATGGASTDVRLSDIATGKTVGVLKGHTDQVVALSFSPDGKKLASASLDKSVLIWNLETDVVQPKGTEP